MGQFNSKKKYFRRFAYLLSALVFFNLFSNNLPPIIGSYHLYAVIWIGSLLLFEPKVFVQKNVLYFLAFGLFFTVILPILIWTSITDWNLRGIRGEFYEMLIPLSVLTYFNFKRDFRGLAWFAKLSIGFMLITGLMTLYSTFKDPMYARMMGAWYDEQTTNYFKRLGGGAYGYVGALLGIFPLLIYYWKNNSLIEYSRRFILIIIIYLFIVVIAMQFFGNILIASLFIILSFSSAKRIKRTAITISILFVIAISVPTKNYAALLQSIAGYFQTDSENYIKIMDMSRFAEAGNESKDPEGVVEGRIIRFPELFQTFLANPLLGSATNKDSAYDQAGGHLYWMNRLAVYGILGFLMIVMFHRFYLKNQLRYFDEFYGIYFILASFAILSYGIIKNIGGREVWYMYFVIIPGMYYLPLLNKNIEE